MGDISIRFLKIWSVCFCKRDVECLKFDSCTCNDHNLKIGGIMLIL